MKEIPEQKRSVLRSNFCNLVHENNIFAFWKNCKKRAGRTTLKSRSLLAVLVTLILPASVFLAIGESLTKNQLLMYLCLHLSLCIAFCFPFAKWLGDLLINRELQAMNDFCVNLKHGKMDQRLDLFQQNATTNPDELIRLQQNLNWLAHTVAKRELSLTRSIEEINKDKERLNLLSYTDHLTGLFNKRFFELKLFEMCSKCVSCKAQLHLILIDCDNFKEVNDLYGHQEGDTLLSGLGRIISQSVRNGTDFPFRFGGDEFGAIIIGVDSSRCEQVAERIRCRFSELKVGRTSLSIGISRLRRNISDPEREAHLLIERADKALYYAKNTGRDKIIGPARYREISQSA